MPACPRSAPRSLPHSLLPHALPPRSLPGGSAGPHPARHRADPHRVRVALITEGTYPIVTGGVSTWCDQLLNGLPDHTFDVVALTGSGVGKAVWDMPPNVRAVRMIPVWGPVASPLRPGPRRRAWIDSTQDALAELWDAALGPDDARPVERTTGALKQLTGISDRIGLAHSLAARGSVAPILSAWARHCLAPGEAPMSVADAVMAAGIVDRALALIDHQLGEVDVIHASSNGPSSLLALAHSWRNGTPILLTEHGVYLRERYLALHGANLSWPVRRTVTAFLRRLCQVVSCACPSGSPRESVQCAVGTQAGGPSGQDPDHFQRC